MTTFLSSIGEEEIGEEEKTPVSTAMVQHNTRTENLTHQAYNAHKEGVMALRGIGYDGQGLSHEFTRSFGETSYKPNQVDSNMRDTAVKCEYLDQEKYKEMSRQKYFAQRQSYIRYRNERPIISATLLTKQENRVQHNLWTSESRFVLIDTKEGNNREFDWHDIVSSVIENNARDLPSYAGPAGVREYNPQIQPDALALHYEKQANTISTRGRPTGYDYQLMSNKSEKDLVGTDTTDIMEFYLLNDELYCQIRNKDPLKITDDDVDDGLHTEIVNKLKALNGANNQPLTVSIEQRNSILEFISDNGYPHPPKNSKLIDKITILPNEQVKRSVMNELLHKVNDNSVVCIGITANRFKRNDKDSNKREFLELLKIQERHYRDMGVRLPIVIYHNGEQYGEPYKDNDGKPFQNNDLDVNIDLLCNQMHVFSDQEIAKILRSMGKMSLTDPNKDLIPAKGPEDIGCYAGLPNSTYYERIPDHESDARENIKRTNALGKVNQIIKKLDNILGKSGLGNESDFLQENMKEVKNKAKCDRFMAVYRSHLKSWDLSNLS